MAGQRTKKPNTTRQVDPEFAIVREGARAMLASGLAAVLRTHGAPARERDASPREDGRGARDAGVGGRGAWSESAWSTSEQGVSGAGAHGSGSEPGAPGARARESPSEQSAPNTSESEQSAPDVSGSEWSASEWSASEWSASGEGRAGKEEPGDPHDAGLADLARALERELHNCAVREARARPRRSKQHQYAEGLRCLLQALPAQVGPYPDDIYGLWYAAGRVKAAAAVGGAAEAVKDAGPRETIRRLFVGTMMRSSALYARDRRLVLKDAREIELSCYNAAVRTSKESEDPPRRQWDSQAFVNIYSTRCGEVNGLLDAGSSACRAYGATLMARLEASHGCSGGDTGGLPPLRAGELGSLTERDLCPQATANERAEIARRSVQKVVVKESKLFRCPNCGANRCTYREVQLRSLDEAADCICLCLDCGRHFRGRQ